MAIQSSGGTLRNDLYPGIVTYPALLSSINTTLVAAGWTSTPVAAYNKIVYTGQPSNNDTVTLNSVVYTFKTAINNANAREILIDSSADNTWANFIVCVNGGAGSGTKYSSATSASATFTASLDAAGTVRVSTITTGPTGTNGLTVSESCANAAFTYIGNAVPLTAWGGYKWTSATTPAGLACRVYGMIRDFDSGNNVVQVRFIVMDSSEAFTCPDSYLTESTSLATAPSTRRCGARLGGNNTTLPSSTWRVIANKYQFFAFADTLYSGAGVFVAAGVPWIPDFLYPKFISAATTASPIAITTTAAHGWTTGNVVSISGVQGLSGANGNFTVTVTGTTTATLNGTTGTGTYTSGGSAAATNVGISNCVWMSNQFTGSACWIYLQLSPSSADWVGSILNGSITDPNGSYSTGTASFITPTDAITTEGADAVTWYNSDVLVTEPLLTTGITNAGTSYLVGQLWNSFLHMRTEAGGVTGTFDSKNWYVITNNATGSTTSREGALVVEVP